MDSPQRRAGGVASFLAVFPSMKARQLLWHDKATIAPGVVRDVLVEDVGLSVQEALRCVRKKR